MAWIPLEGSWALSQWTSWLPNSILSWVCFFFFFFLPLITTFFLAPVWTVQLDCPTVHISDIGDSHTYISRLDYSCALVPSLSLLFLSKLTFSTIMFRLFIRTLLPVYQFLFSYFTPSSRKVITICFCEISKLVFILDTSLPYRMLHHLVSILFIYFSLCWLLDKDLLLFVTS